MSDDKTLELIAQLRKLATFMSKHDDGICRMEAGCPDEAADLLTSYHAAANELGYENFNAMVEGVIAKAIGSTLHECGIFKKPSGDSWTDGPSILAARAVIAALTNRSAT
ncbi:MAG: hypothetical protein V4696_01560 [Pseudomonadota bacterium]